jgi:hypothetical protein
MTDFKPEKDTNRSGYDDKGVNVYDNDDAYMLNDDEKDGQENIYSLDELHEHDINDNESEINAARGYRNEVKELTDEETIRIKQQEYDKHEDEGRYL